MIVFAFIALLAGAGVRGQSDCVDKDPTLTPWSGVDDPTADVQINNQKFLLTSNTLRARSITITNYGKLVLSDQIGAINVEFKYMLITGNGEFHIGSETCKHTNPVDILLVGRSDDTDYADIVPFGRKFIGVTPTGTISIHGVSKTSWTVLTSDLTAGTANARLDVFDDVSSWSAGDRVVIASSDYDMNHAEEFTLATCSACTVRQVQISGTPQYTHLGSMSAQGVDTRAEIGLLTRNIKIHGQMESACYANNWCQYFDYDTYGGHIQMLANFKKAVFEGIELYNMGQQQLGKYPVHYHVVGPVYGNYARQLAIHHCFSRCVTLHASEGLTVQDVVGYDTLGHCFFLEDGNEQNNQLIHNLGLVTKPGTLLPSDRDKNMCETMLDNVYPGYIPNAESECMGVSTFWLAHPNNTLRNNSAAGSTENGFHFMFHRVPTGPSAGTLPPYDGERSNIPICSGNKAHSNADTAFLLDRGVKVESATVDDPSEFLSLQDYARYMPHQNKDPLQPRYPSQLLDITAYKNEKGIVVRGGDVYIRNARLSDNDVGVIMKSDDLLPQDSGSHQELTGSVIVSTSNPDAEWQARSYPSVGVQLTDGPVLVDSNYFYGYTAAGGREAYALGFVPQSAGQLGTTNTLGSNSADQVQQKVYFGRADPTSVYGNYDSDGDKFQIFYDRDGQITGWINAYAIRRDNLLLRGDSCTEVAAANCAVCIGVNYGQLYVNATTKTANMTIDRLGGPSNPVVLRGANKADTLNFPRHTQYQATVIVDRDYTISFSEATPSWLQLSAHNFHTDGWAKVAISYPNAPSTFTVSYLEWQQMSNTVVTDEPLTAGSSVADVDADPQGKTYYWDSTNNLLYVKLVNFYVMNGYDYCAAEGCQFIRVVTA